MKLKKKEDQSVDVSVLRTGNKICMRGRGRDLGGGEEGKGERGWDQYGKREE